MAELGECQDYLVDQTLSCMIKADCFITNGVSHRNGFRGPHLTMPKSGEREILSKVRDMLDTAKFGLADLVGDDPGRSLAGLMNVATFGRAVTNVLQNLRSVTPDFDKSSGLLANERMVRISGKD